MFIKRLIVEARRSCARRQHEVARERRLNRDFRRFKVANLADQMMFGSCRKKRAQRRAKFNPNLFFHLD